MNFTTVKYRSTFLALVVGVALLIGGCAPSTGLTISDSTLLNRMWRNNKSHNTHVGVVCETPTTSSSCYIFTGYAANVDRNGVVTIIDEDHNVIRFVNMSCVIAPAEQLGDDVCIRDVMPDVD